MSLLRRILAKEEVQNVEKENEMVFYGRIKNLDDLKKAGHMETHEQYEIKAEKTEANAASGRVRVRKTVGQGSDTPEYVLTIKTPISTGGDTENNIGCDIRAFIQFQHIAEKGMIKDRYFFKLDEKHNWEVDVFKASNGAYHAWCKIDLEHTGFIGNIPDFPIELEEVISAQDGHRTPEEQQKVDTLYETVFTVPNPFR